MCLQRCAVFMDGGYMDNIHRELGNPKIDFVQLVHSLTDGYDLLRAYYYNCLPYQPPAPGPEDKLRMSSKQKFFATISKLPDFTVREGKLAYRGLDQNGVVILEQKRVDVLLATDLVMHAAKHLITHAVLFAGDSDFIPAVEIAKNEGVNVHLFSVGVENARPHEDLIMACDRHTMAPKEDYLKFVRDL